MREDHGRAQMSDFPAQTWTFFVDDEAIFTAVGTPPAAGSVIEHYDQGSVKARWFQVIVLLQVRVRTHARESRCSANHFLRGREITVEDWMLIQKDRFPAQSHAPEDDDG